MLELIIDANVSTKILRQPCDAAYADVYDLLFVRHRFPNLAAKLAYGGKLTDEYQKAGLLSIVQSLDAMGRAIPYNRILIEKEAIALKAGGLCKSNDHHVLAIARLGTARLLCSEDKRLHSDFKNRNVIAKPKGKIYSAQAHSIILAKLNRQKR